MRGSHPVAKLLKREVAVAGKIQPQKQPSFLPSQIHLQKHKRFKMWRRTNAARFEGRRRGRERRVEGRGRTNSPCCFSTIPSPLGLHPRSLSKFSPPFSPYVTAVKNVDHGSGHVGLFVESHRPVRLWWRGHRDVHHFVCDWRGVVRSHFHHRGNSAVSSMNVALWIFYVFIYDSPMSIRFTLGAAGVFS